MLSYLKIENFSVFDKAEIELESGLNIITGETGAGKSLLVESIKLLLGDRFSKEKQRDPSKKTVFEAQFDDIQLENDIKEQYEIDDFLIIRREIDANGRNKIFINSHLSTINDLKKIGKKLIDIHGQHDHQQLLNPEMHVHLIDKFIDQENLSKFKEAYEKYQEISKKLKFTINNKQELEIKKDILQEKLGEIESLNINIEEDAKLEEKIKFLSNIEKIKVSLDTALQNLSFGDISAEKLISEAINSIFAIKNINKEFNSIYDRLNNLSYELNDIVQTLQMIFDYEDINTDQLNSLIDRKMQIDKLLKKYGPTLEDLIQYSENLKKEIKELNVDDTYIQELEQEKERIFSELKKLDEKLNEERKIFAKKLKKEIEKILKELELKDAVFEVKFIQKEEITPLGSKIPEFYISTNKGFEPAPLGKVASGGELSRIMLALKEIFAEADNINTLIFDEVDTGISGKTAKKVSEKLAKLAQKKQLIVITHLPIVAAAGNAHFHILKSTENEQTYTKVIKLDKEERLNTIATMISGKITDSSLKQAKELLS